MAERTYVPAQLRRQVDGMCAAAVGQAARIQQELPRLMARAAISIEGTRCVPSDGGPLGGGSVSDPVLAEILEIEACYSRDGKFGVPAGVNRDPVGAWGRWAVASLATALEALDTVLYSIGAAKAVPTHQQPTESSGQEGCTNCAKHAVWSPIRAGGRCSNCYEYSRRHDGAERPRRLVVAEKTGRRVRQKVKPPIVAHR